MQDSKDYFYAIIQEQFKTIKELTDKVIKLTVDYNKVIEDIQKQKEKQQQQQQQQYEVQQNNINMDVLEEELNTPMPIGQKVMTA
jgi:cell shape-determining protein MreC